MPFFEQNPLMFILLIIAIVETWNAGKRVLSHFLPPVLYEEEQR